MLVQTRKRLKWQQACGKRQVAVPLNGSFNGAISASRIDQNNHDRQTVSVINKDLRLSLRTVGHVPLYSKNRQNTVHKTTSKHKQRETDSVIDRGTMVRSELTKQCQIMDHTCDSCFLTN